MKIYLLIFFFLMYGTQASSWTRFHGPNDDDTIKAEKGFSVDLTKWTKLWETKVGLGYSSMIVEGQLAFNMSHDKANTETIHCLNAETGKEIWRYDYQGPLLNRLHKGGPNSSPTIEGRLAICRWKSRPSTLFK